MSVLLPDQDARTDADSHVAGTRILTSESMVFWIGAALIIGVAALQFEPLLIKSLQGDLGLQYHLSGETLRGAVPLRDFEHGWNAGGWVAGAALYFLVGGNPTLFSFVWQRVLGQMLTGLVLLVVARRLRWETPWIVGLVATWLLLSHVPHGKYAIPALWLLVALPTGRLDRGVAAVGARLLLGAVTFWLHVDLAIMLGAGLFLYDLLASTSRPFRTRLVRALAPGVGALLALGIQVGVYAAIGMAPSELVGFLILDRGSTVPGVNFGFPILDPAIVPRFVYPAGLLVAFVPAVWRRTTPSTRLAAFLQLGLALIVIRKADAPHVTAASSLLPFVVVSVARDLSETFAERASTRPEFVRRVAVGTATVAGIAVVLGVAFWVHSLVAWIVVLALVAGAASVGSRWDLPGSGAGAALAFLGVAVMGLAGQAGFDSIETRGNDRSIEIAATIPRDVDKCLPESREALIVGGPLPLYRFLDVENPTPFYLFHSGFAGEAGRFQEMVDAGQIPAVIQVGFWPESFEGSILPIIESDFEVCSIRHVLATSDRVVLWRWNGLPPVE